MIAGNYELVVQSGPVCNVSYEIKFKRICDAYNKINVYVGKFIFTIFE